MILINIHQMELENLKTIYSLITFLKTQYIYFNIFFSIEYFLALHLELPILLLGEIVIIFLYKILDRKLPKLI